MSNNSTPRIDILIRSWPKLIASASKSKYDFQLKLVFLKHFNKHLISSTPVSTPCYSWVFIFKCIQTFKVEHKLIRCNSIVSLLTSTGYKWLLWLNELDQCNLIYQKSGRYTVCPKDFMPKVPPKAAPPSFEYYWKQLHQISDCASSTNSMDQKDLETGNFYNRF